MLEKEQVISKRNSSTISKLDKMRNFLALSVSKHSKLTEICKKLHKCSLIYTPLHIYVQLEKHPITEFEREMAKNLEDSLNDVENLYNAYCKEQIKNKHETKDTK